MPRPVGAWIPKITKQALRKKGFTLFNIIADWAEIVGPNWAKTTQPQKMTYRPEGILYIRVDSGATALLIKHAEPQIVDRINSYFGYQAIAQIKCQHYGRPFATYTRKKQKTHLDCKNKVIAPAPQELSEVKNEALRESLANLYQAMQIKKQQH